MICKDPFAPPKELAAGDSKHFLALKLEHLVRVTSLMKPDMQWYFGQLDNQDAVKGWFPKRSVKLAPCQISASPKGLLEQALSGVTTMAAPSVATAPP